MLAHTVSKKERAHAVADRECIEKEDEDLLWYFAIGSMMNITSMNLRGLFPKQSLPGILRGWELVFRGVGGMGDIDQKEGASFHGILHQLTPAQFAMLDKIEMTYNRTPVNVECYDGTIVSAFAYKMDQKKLAVFSQVNNPPGERYLDIITRGAVHFGVDPAYIAKLRTVTTQPRKQLHEYRKIQPPPDRVISKAELAAGTGAEQYDENKPLLISCNGKVLRWAVKPETESQQFGYNWARSRYSGTECVVDVAKTLYEPLYPLPTTFDEMTPECRSWGEELFVGFMLRDKQNKQEGYTLGNLEVIGWLEGQEPERLRQQPQQPASS